MERPAEERKTAEWIEELEKVLSCKAMFPRDLSKISNACKNHGSCDHGNSGKKCPYSEFWLTLNVLKERALGGTPKPYWTCRFRDAPKGCLFTKKPFDMHTYQDGILVEFNGYYCPYDHSENSLKVDCPNGTKCTRKGCKFAHPTPVDEKEEAFVDKPQMNAESNSDTASPQGKKVGKCTHYNTCTFVDCGLSHGIDDINERRRRKNANRKSKKDTSEPKVKKDTSEPKVKKDTSEPKVQKDTSESKVQEGTSEPKVQDCNSIKEEDYSAFWESERQTYANRKWIDHLKM
jgi:hypothetical protein